MPCSSHYECKKDRGGRLLLTVAPYQVSYFLEYLKINLISAKSVPKESLP